MGMFAIWLRRNKVALGVATSMFALMATVMAIMIYKDWSVIGDLVSVADEKMSSPFLWVWRVGGLFTWPVLYMLLLRPYAGDGSSKAGGTVAIATLVGALYGGFGMWGTNELVALLLQGVDGANLRSTVGAEFGILLIIDLISLAYTWGFCAIYAVALGRLSGRRGTDWVLPSIGYALLGRWIGSVAVSLLLFIVMYVFLMVIMTMSGFDWTLVVIPVAIALSVGNFVGQWPGFWVAHDRVLGIMPMPTVPYPTPMAVAPGQGMAPNGAFPMGYPAYPASPTPPYPESAMSMPYQPAGMPFVAQVSPENSTPLETSVTYPSPTNVAYGRDMESVSQPSGIQDVGK